MKLKKGDNIIVTAGKDKGKTGTIEKVFPKENTVQIAGINMYKKHMKKRDEKNAGGIFDLPRPLNASKVALIDKKTKKPTRVGYVVTKGEKIRIAKKSGDKI